MPPHLIFHITGDLLLQELVAIHLPVCRTDVTDEEDTTGVPEALAELSGEVVGHELAPDDDPIRLLAVKGGRVDQDEVDQWEKFREERDVSPRGSTAVDASEWRGERSIF
jgi:hypothetical protein